MYVDISCVFFSNKNLSSGSVLYKFDYSITASRKRFSLYHYGPIAKLKGNDKKKKRFISAPSMISGNKLNGFPFRVVEICTQYRIYVAPD